MFPKCDTRQDHNLSLSPGWQGHQHHGHHLLPSMCTFSVSCTGQQSWDSYSGTLGLDASLLSKGLLHQIPASQIFLSPFAYTDFPLYLYQLTFSFHLRKLFEVPLDIYFFKIRLTSAGAVLSLRMSTGSSPIFSTSDLALLI